MTFEEIQAPILSHTDERPYQQMSLIDLAERIDRFGDPIALHELHSFRTLFQLRGEEPMLMVSFITRVCEKSWVFRLCGYDRSAADVARDLTQDKFFQLSQEKGSKQSGPDYPGPDCRHYYRGFLAVVRKWQASQSQVGTLRDEIVAARILQRMVVRHIRLSCLEARRNANPTRSRYTWPVNGGSIAVFMPTAMRGCRRRTWLEENVDDPNPSRPDERNRIQAIINDRLGDIRHVPFDDDDGVSFRQPPRTGLVSSIEHDISVNGLAKVVADEKADNIHKQRPAIRSLGRSNLKRMILRVFEDLSSGSYEEKALAEGFGLSRATVSRFAGIRWDMSRRIPDLWVNLSQTLANHASFIEAAQDANVWQEVQKVLGHHREIPARRTHDA